MNGHLLVYFTRLDPHSAQIPGDKRAIQSDANLLCLQDGVAILPPSHNDLAGLNCPRKHRRGTSLGDQDL